MKNHLLLIGIDNYNYFPKEISYLPTCVKDIVDFKYVLLEKYHFEQENIIELLDENATNENIQLKLENYSKNLDETTNLIIYFSGHGGFRKGTQKGYWIPSDGLNTEFTTWIPNETIIEIVKKNKC